jgi:hypothetical protein
VFMRLWTHSDDWSELATFPPETMDNVEWGTPWDNFLRFLRSSPSGDVFKVWLIATVVIVLVLPLFRSFVRKRGLTRSKAGLIWLVASLPPVTLPLLLLSVNGAHLQNVYFLLWLLVAAIPVVVGLVIAGMKGRAAQASTS